jgi:hypothetical protein
MKQLELFTDQLWKLALLEQERDYYAMYCDIWSLDYSDERREIDMEIDFLKGSIKHKGAYIIPALPDSGIGDDDEY